MSLLKRKQEKDRKAAEEAARLAEEKKLQDLAVHPLVKDGCSRDVMDAYFQGLVFAAIADDDKIDENERPLLVEIGTSLGMSGEEVEGTIKGVQSLDDDGKISLVEECVAALKDNEVGVKLFFAQFIQIWTSHEHDKEELGEYLGKFAKWTGVGLDQEKRKAILAAIAGGKGLDEGLYVLAEWMGDEALKYFVVRRHGDVSAVLGRQKEIQAAKNKEEQKKLGTQKLIEAIGRKAEELKHEYKDRPILLGNRLDGLRKIIPVCDIGWKDVFVTIVNDLKELPNNSSDTTAILRRKVVWKIACAFYVFRKGKFSLEVLDEIHGLFVAANSSTAETYLEKVVDFLKKQFPDDVEVPEVAKTYNAASEVGKAVCWVLKKILLPPLPLPGSPLKPW